MSSLAVSPHRLSQAIAEIQRYRAFLAETDPELAADEGELLGLIGADLPETADLARAMETIHRLIRAAILMRERSQAADDALARQKGRRDRYTARYDALRHVVLNVMQAIGQKRIDTHDFTVSRRATAPHVVITDETALPEEYVRVIVNKVPDKMKIREDLSEGVVIEGATLSNAGESVIIRTD